MIVTIGKAYGTLRIDMKRPNYSIGTITEIVKAGVVIGEPSHRNKLKKAEAEALLVSYIEVIGLKRCIVLADGKDLAYEFTLKNDERKYWKNMSEDNLARIRGGYPNAGL